MHWATLGAVITVVIGVLVVITCLPSKSALAASADQAVTPVPQPESRIEQGDLAEAPR